MTQCSLGSEPKEDAPVGLWITWAGLISWASSAFIVRFVPSIVDWFPDQFELADSFCATEPAPVSEPDLFTWLNGLARNPSPAALVEIGQYLGARYRSYLWPTLCQCVPAEDASEYCTIKGPVALNYPANGTNGTSALGNNSTYVNANVFADGASGGSVKFPVGQHLTRFTINANFNGTIEGYYTGVAETYIGAFSSGVTTQIVHSWPTGMAELAIVWRNNTSTGGGGMDLTIEFMNASGEAACSPYDPGDVYTPDPVEVPPEIPDIPTVSLCDSFEDVCAQINLIRLQIDALGRTTTTTINTGAPASWWPGVASTGLTGHGTLAVSGIVGAIVECDVPLWWEKGWTTPTIYKPVIGSIQWGVAGIESEAEWIKFDQQLVLGAPGLTDHIVWNFPAGVTGSITPLYRATVAAP